MWVRQGRHLACCFVVLRRVVPAFRATAHSLQKSTCKFCGRLGGLQRLFTP